LALAAEVLSSEVASETAGLRALRSLRASSGKDGTRSSTLVVRVDVTPATTASCRKEISLAKCALLLASAAAAATATDASSEAGEGGMVAKEREREEERREKVVPPSSASTVSQK
jgi:hypothetical protein